MDNSVSSIEMLARLFNLSLRKRGFTRAIHREMGPCQTSGLLQQSFGVLGLVVAGEIEFVMSEAHEIYGAGEEFTIPANTYFQATAGHNGTHLLIAKKRLNSDTTETLYAV
jgi:hypothetical protein